MGYLIQAVTRCVSRPAAEDELTCASVFSWASVVTRRRVGQSKMTAIKLLSLRSDASARPRVGPMLPIGICSAAESSS